MGKRWRATAMGLVCLLGLALATPWGLLSAPIDRAPRVGESRLPFELPDVRLDFADPSAMTRRITTDEPPQAAPRLSIEPAKVPAEIPGAAPPITLPKFDPADAKAFADTIDKLYPPLPPTGVVMSVELGPDGRPMTLADIERLAAVHCPFLRQAAVETALPPRVGFCNLESLFVTRQRYAKAIAAADRELSRLALAGVEGEVFAGVRRGYFAVLAAQESMRVQEAMTRFCDDAYRVQVERVKAGQSPASSPLSLRALAYQSRVNLSQARNRYVSAWKQLAATVGRVDLPPTLLEGRVDRPLPILSFEAVYDVVLTQNSALSAAHYELEKALAAQRAIKLMPFAVFHRTSAAKARAEVLRAEEEPARVRTALNAALADAFERYDNQRRLLAYSRDHIIPDLAQAYRAVAARSNGAESANAAEIVAAQQALAAAVTTYLQSLGDAWFAVVDLGKLMQSSDLFRDCGGTDGSQVACLFELPSCRVGSATLDWPDVMPAGNARIATRPPAPCLPPTNFGPTPTTDSLLPMPLGSIEMSTKRRKFFGWPVRRPDSDAPKSLPQAAEPERCCPPSEAPQLPLTTPRELELPSRLPDGPLKQSRVILPSLPMVVEGQAGDRTPSQVIVVEGRELVPAAPAILPAEIPAGETLYLRMPQPIPQPVGSVPPLRVPAIRPR